MVTNKSIFVDFDGTICPNKNGDDYAPPQPECIEVLKRLQAFGHTIVIYSVRSNLNETFKQNGHQLMVDYLKKHNVPYDSIDCSKSHFRCIIDDKCLGIPLYSDGNVRWDHVGELLERKKYI
jgi:histidinol phosphatase-like enzyme